MKKVTVQPGCITCGACEFIAPEVFEIDVTARVRDGVDVAAHTEAIKEAVRACPVAVITYVE